ncbi:MAG: histidine--tRNA ligase [Candidatus Eisenbacteria bacterium]|nr:histidine--tRNA ligase [Candidatus Eisenbacteria bacterium]MCC7141175.1 histidine--tRNA ligase [Candidatus Eisenbacteria bacterium]
MSRIEPRTFRGARDFLPAEMIRREGLFAYLREVFQRHGFAPIETPAIEYLEVLLGKYGSEGEKLIYPLAYKGGTTAALRYDLTVPLARVVAQYRDLPRPFKRYQMQPVWRADTPTIHQGRYREFYQCDADIVGEASPLADAEILSMIGEVIAGLGVGNFTVRVNHRAVLEGMVGAAGLPPEANRAVLRAIDKFDKVGLAGVEKELEKEGIEDMPRSKLLDLLALPSGGREAILALADRWSGEPRIGEGAAELLRIWQALEQISPDLGRFQFCLTLARGLDYYTGAVFESFIDDLPHMGSLSGGGRYDDLVGVFSEESLPAVGTTIGLDRIFSALEQLGQAGGTPTRTQVMVLQFGPESEGPALRTLRRLRQSGLRAEVWYRPERLGKQIQQADKRGVPLVLFQGPDEAAAGIWTLKVLTSGEQIQIPEADLEARVRALATP